MDRLVVCCSLVIIAGTLSFARLSPSHAGAACKRTEFKTTLVKEACQKGGQAAAKDAMKAFMKKAKIKDCKACHSNLAPAYELKSDGLDKYRKAGGS